MVARAASHRYRSEAAKAKSRTLSARKRQVRRVPGRVARPAARSASVTTRTVLSVVAARARRAAASEVSTSPGFCRTPVAPTRCPAGRVMATSKSPYSR
ncbi:MAG: hypothetical protein AVDCRST_MAG89-3642 [uncultured Gemmatimonadetes bacterium]|uniref:Uncharacterized protein n=1 Tax=uncultured Gemmatimonadota bacterium TaxID=203437 RepID=A0A6J4MJQ6_9BACT|nr:MAG: hypothetical protein AVDCRST_MAG89-3642 [uncultured Gemmatimonadota bacterium]